MGFEHAVQAGSGFALDFRSTALVPFTGVCFLPMGILFVCADCLLSVGDLSVVASSTFCAAFSPSAPAVIHAVAPSCTSGFCWNPFSILSTTRASFARRRRFLALRSFLLDGSGDIALTYSLPDWSDRGDRMSEPALTSGS